VALWVRRLQSLLDTYTDEHLALCKARKQQQLPTDSSSSSAPGKQPKALLLPTAAKAGIKWWYKYQQQQQQQQPGAKEAAAAAAAGAAASLDGAADQAAAVLSQMKYFLVNAPLAARVCMASSDSQVRRLSLMVSFLTEYCRLLQQLLRAVSTKPQQCWSCDSTQATMTQALPSALLTRRFTVARHLGSFNSLCVLHYVAELLHAGSYATAAHRMANMMCCMSHSYHAAFFAETPFTTEPPARWLVAHAA
jgi:hypothetical protein